MNELGCLLFSLLDYGLKESEERALSPSMESLIDWLTVNMDTNNEDCSDSSITDYDSGTESMMDGGGPASLIFHNINSGTLSDSVPIDNFSDVLQVKIVVSFICFLTNFADV